MSLKNIISPIYQEFLAKEIKEVPEHIAIIQDGNRRFALEKGEEATQGHIYGAKKTEKVLDWSFNIGVKKITLYTLSIQNFNRSEEELKHLFDIIEKKLLELKEEDKIHDERVRIRGIGKIKKLPKRVREALNKAEASTNDYNRYQLDIAIGYGGREELLNASLKILKKIKKGKIEPKDVDENIIWKHVYTNTQEVDLLIRTGGEERTSNFLPWQANGSESVVYFCDPYWPEFRKIDFLRAIRAYSNRKTEYKQVGIKRAKNIIFPII